MNSDYTCTNQPEIETPVFRENLRQALCERPANTDEPLVGKLDRILFQRLFCQRMKVVWAVVLLTGAVYIVAGLDVSPNQSGLNQVAAVEPHPNAAREVFNANKDMKLSEILEQAKRAQLRAAFQVSSQTPIVVADTRQSPARVRTIAIDSGNQSKSGLQLRSAAAFRSSLAQASPSSHQVVQFVSDQGEVFLLEIRNNQVYSATRILP